MSRIAPSEPLQIDASRESAGEHRCESTNQTRRPIAGAVLPLIFAIVMAVLCQSARAADLPVMTGRVVDDAKVLTPATRERLNNALKVHQQKTSDQVAVLTVPTIGDVSIEEYATKVFEAWKPGIKGKDNGVLIVVVTKDRKMRIEVGYGLEGTLTDVEANRIIRDFLTPQFKAGNYDKGIEDGVAAVIAKLERTPTTPPEPPAAPIDWAGLSAAGCTFLLLSFFFYRGVRTPGIGGWMILPISLPFWLFPFVVLNTTLTFVLLAIYVIAFPIVKLIVPRDLNVQGRTGDPSIVSYNSTSDGGSSGDSGSSGGGGESGGGGSSGSW